MNHQALDLKMTELRLQELSAKDEMMECLQEINDAEVWRVRGFKSMRDFCEKELGYDEFEIREILISIGVIVTQDQMTGHDPDVQKRIDVLRDWRRKKSFAMSLPAYMIFSNRTLLSIAMESPSSLESLAKISGIGTKKIEAFGSEVLACLATILN